MLVEGLSHGFALQLLTATHMSDYKKEAPVVKWGKIFPTHLGCWDMHLKKRSSPTFRMIWFHLLHNHFSYMCPSDNSNF